jgi:putative ABC transport system substrate-binding protein
MRRIGMLTNLTENDPVGHARSAAFLRRLQQLGWIEGRNLRIEQRWTGGTADLIRKYAAEFKKPRRSALQSLTPPSPAPTR